MDTIKLYASDPLLKTFTATVLDCQPLKNGYSVVLDRTAFYPEGGGQPADYGTLNGIPVTDVQERDGHIFHICAKNVENGTNATGVLDWERRFDHTQQHSGEHIISGILCSTYRCDNVGFHMGADVVTIDYNAEITWEQALEAEAQANAVIAADQPVEITYPTQEELKNLTYRSKKELTGQVRIVTFPGADCCACCGTHVLRAGQVGLVKVLSLQKFRSGVRIEIVSGKRALQLLSRMYEQNRAVAQSLSVKAFDTAAAVDRTLSELAAAKVRMTELEETVFAAKAKEFAAQGDLLLFEAPMRPDAVRKLADAVAHTCGGLAAVFAGKNDTYHYALVRTDGAALTKLVTSLNATLNGRGGGQNGFAQGSVHADQMDIESFFQEKS